MPPSKHPGEVSSAYPRGNAATVLKDELPNTLVAIVNLGLTSPMNILMKDTV